MAKSVQNNQPREITASFKAEDAIIYVWFSYQNATEGAKAKAVWRRRGSKLESESSATNLKPGAGVGWFSLEKPGETSFDTVDILVLLPEGTWEAKATIQFVVT